MFVSYVVTVFEFVVMVILVGFYFKVNVRFLRVVFSSVILMCSLSFLVFSYVLFSIILLFVVRIAFRVRFEALY